MTDKTTSTPETVDNAAAIGSRVQAVVRCETCKYRDHYEDVAAVDEGRTSYGRCRRFPAQYMPDAYDGNGEDPWCKWNQPAMFDDEWCGEYTPNMVPTDRMMAKGRGRDE